MMSLVFILITLALLIGFFFLVNYETRQGVRLYAESRTHLDKHVERIEFILAHINLGAFLYEEARSLVSRVWHDIVHLSLLLVRAVERLLTRMIRHHHAKNATDTAPVESTREFVKTLSEFKEQLDGTHPEIADIK